MVSGEAGRIPGIIGDLVQRRSATPGDQTLAPSEPTAPCRAVACREAHAPLRFWCIDTPQRQWESEAVLFFQERPARKGGCNGQDDPFPPMDLLPSWRIVHE